MPHWKIIALKNLIVDLLRTAEKGSREKRLLFTAFNELQSWSDQQIAERELKRGDAIIH
jgi:hypothetical protein